MKARLQEYLASVPHLYPHALERAFPHVLERIVAAWPSPSAASAVFEDVLIDQRGSRQGFPNEVVREIFNLSVFYGDAHASGQTPLLQAAASGQIGAVRLLLAAGADPNVATREGCTPLHKAVENGHDEIVRLLIDAGASATARHHTGATPLSIAAKRENDESATPPASWHPPHSLHRTDSE